MIPKGTLVKGMKVFRVESWDGGACPAEIEYEVTSVAPVYTTLKRVRDDAITPLGSRVQTFTVERNYFATESEAWFAYAERMKVQIELAKRSIVAADIGITKAEEALAALRENKP